MADLVKIMISTMTEHFERQAERNKKRSDEDYDEGKFLAIVWHFWLLTGCFRLFLAKQKKEVTKIMKVNFVFWHF